jgi:hypothetical protein
MLLSYSLLSVYPFFICSWVRIGLDHLAKLANLAKLYDAVALKEELWLHIIASD